MYYFLLKNASIKTQIIEKWGGGALQIASKHPIFYDFGVY